MNKEIKAAFSEIAFLNTAYKYQPIRQAINTALKKAIKPIPLVLTFSGSSVCLKLGKIEPKNTLTKVSRTIVTTVTKVIKKLLIPSIGRTCQRIKENNSKGVLIINPKISLEKSILSFDMGKVKIYQALDPSLAISGYTNRNKKAVVKKVNQKKEKITNSLGQKFSVFLKINIRARKK